MSRWRCMRVCVRARVRAELYAIMSLHNTMKMFEIKNWETMPTTDCHSHCRWVLNRIDHQMSNICDAIHNKPVWNRISKSIYYEPFSIGFHRWHIIRMLYRTKTHIERIFIKKRNRARKGMTNSLAVCFFFIYCSDFDQNCWRWLTATRWTVLNLDLHWNEAWWISCDHKRRHYILASQRRIFIAILIMSV